MARHKKTGGGGGAWIEFDSPKPSAVKDHYSNHTEASGKLSERCEWWLRQIERGWRPNRRSLNCCWDCNSEWLGVYAWEYMGPICEALQNGRFGDFDRAQAERQARIPLGPKTAKDSFGEFIREKLTENLDDELAKAILYGEGARIWPQRKN